MGHEARLSRRSVLSASHHAVDKVQECVAAVNVQAARIQELEARVQAQGLMIVGLETAAEKRLAEVSQRLTLQAFDYRDRQLAFERMGLVARLWWVLTGAAKLPRPVMGFPVQRAPIPTAGALEPF